MVILGTKWPSITSIWIQSAPAASIASISAPSLEKSAERMDGAMRMGWAMRLSAGFCYGLQGTPVLGYCQQQHQAGQPDDPRLVTVMRVGKGAADDGVADQPQKHQRRQAGADPDALHTSPPKQ